MSRICFLPSRALTTVVTTLALLPLTAYSATTNGQQVDAQVNLATFDQVWTTVRDEHYDPQLGGIDWEAVRDELRPKAEQARSRSALRGILNGMLSRLQQSHLAVMPGAATPSTAEGDAFTPPSEQTWDSGSGFAVALIEGQAQVASVEPDSAVAQAGVQAGWQIARVGDHAVPRFCETTGAVNFPLLRASGASIVVEFIDPDGGPLEVEIPFGKRRGREYQFEGMLPIQVWIEHELIEPDIGYIAFNWFFDPVLVMSQFHAAMSSFQRSAGVIIDIRGNSGGIGSMASGIIAMFNSQEDAYLGTTIMRNSEQKSHVPPCATPFSRPVAVLIDGASGSAAEIFAAGMRDVGGARLFGQTTTGAVLPAAFARLPNGDSLLYIIANYETVSGETLEGTGVVPDRVTSRRAGSDPYEDEALQLAIDWILGNE